jgi:hypothetical protein
MVGSPSPRYLVGDLAAKADGSISGSIRRRPRALKTRCVSEPRRWGSDVLNPNHGESAFDPADIANDRVPKH